MLPKEILDFWTLWNAISCYLAAEFHYSLRLAAKQIVMHTLKWQHSNSYNNNYKKNTPDNFNLNNYIKPENSAL